LPNVANKDIVLVHDLGFWQKDALMGLGILSHGLAEEGAKTITLIVPYLPYGRQNGGKNGDGFHILHKILGAFPLHRVVTCDAHALHFLEERPGFFHAIPGAAIFFPHLVDQAIDLVVAPDQGAQGRAALLAKYLGCPWIGLSKIRDPQDESSVAIDCALPQRILNQRCVIIDDILDTGRTLAKSTTYLWQHGAKTVVACMTHGFFTQGALERIQSCGLKDLWISNSVPTFLQDQTGTLTIHRVCWAQALAGPLNR
jgi:ribose-phosphate pyrophosphokinase